MENIEKLSKELKLYIIEQHSFKVAIINKIKLAYLRRKYGHPFPNTIMKGLEKDIKDLVSLYNFAVHQQACIDNEYCGEENKIYDKAAEDETHSEESCFLFNEYFTANTDLRNLLKEEKDEELKKEFEGILDKYYTMINA